MSPVNVTPTIRNNRRNDWCISVGFSYVSTKSSCFLFPGFDQRGTKIPENDLLIGHWHCGKVVRNWLLILFLWYDQNLPADATLPKLAFGCEWYGSAYPDNQEKRCDHSGKIECRKFNGILQFSDILQYITILLLLLNDPS